MTCMYPILAEKRACFNMWCDCAVNYKAIHAPWGDVVRVESGSNSVSVLDRQAQKQHTLRYKEVGGTGLISE